MSSSLFEQRFIWERQNPNCLIRYCVLRNDSGMYAVLAADFLYPGFQHDALSQARI